MLNRRECFKYIAGALGLAAIPVVPKSNYVPALLTPGEFVINKKYWPTHDLLISPEALADIRSWECSEDDMKKFVFDEWDGQFNYVYGPKTPQV